MYGSMMHVCMMHISVILDPDACIYCIKYLSMILDKQTFPTLYCMIISFPDTHGLFVIIHNSPSLTLQALPICGPNQASGIQRQLIKVKGSRVTRRSAPTYFSPTSSTAIALWVFSGIGRLPPSENTLSDPSDICVTCDL